MILQIRATSGGGKTTAMKYLYALAGCKPMRRQGNKVVINRGQWVDSLAVTRPVFAIGPYDEGGTGGCDRISKIEDVVALVTLCADHSPDAIVIFEGLLLAHSWGQMGEAMHERYSHRYTNAFIDVTVEQCVANVLARRLAAGAENTDERVQKITKNIVADHHRVYLAWKRVVARGGNRIDVPYQRSGPYLAEHIDAWCQARSL